MARPKKPCEFCEADQINSQDEGKNQLSVEFYPDNNLFAISAYGTDENGETVELNMDFRFDYCPRCGRKIGY